MKHQHLIDSHVHLDMIPDVNHAVENARAAGIGAIVAVGTNKASNEKTLALSRQFPDMVLPAIGYHPWAIVEEDITETLSFVERHLAGCVALGEVGLDYKIKVKKRLQQQVFESLVGVAAKYRKPVNVHARYSFERAHAMLRQAGIERAVFHWYSGPLDVLDRILDSGYFISATPALAYSDRHRAAVERAPVDQVLIETDAPEEYQGKASEPASLRTALKELTGLKKGLEADIADATTKNARWFYGVTAER